MYALLVNKSLVPRAGTSTSHLDLELVTLFDLLPSFVIDTNLEQASKDVDKRKFPEATKPPKCNENALLAVI